MAVSQQKQQSVIPLPPRNVCSAHYHLCGFEQVSGLTFFCFFPSQPKPVVYKKQRFAGGKTSYRCGGSMGFSPISLNSKAPPL